MWMPRKMAGSEISRMLELTIAISMPSVVLESTIHLYRAPGAGVAAAVVARVSITRCGRTAMLLPYSRFRAYALRPYIGARSAPYLRAGSPHPQPLSLCAGEGEARPDVSPSPRERGGRGVRRLDG